MDTYDLRSCTEEDLRQVCQELGLKRFRALQLFQWVQQKAVRSWSEISNIGKEDRLALSSRLQLQPLERVKEQRSVDGTRKYLFRLADGELIECVLMDYAREQSRDRHTVCVSTQVGCAVGCAFCATGMEGLRRNLTAGEILGQVLDITRFIRQEDPDFQVTNVVFMGMGEPLLNYEQVLRAISLMNQERGLNIGMRRMTVSTSGVVPQIIQLARDNSQVGLAVSLHAADDETRNRLVPMNRRYPLAQLMEACREYTTITRRRITFEVALTADNANREQAEALVRLLKGQLGHVNLIPVNPVAGTGLERPDLEKLKRFAHSLEAGGISVSWREERGTDINAACGQLRRQWRVGNNESIGTI
ncbi:23S rRNA (adenine(2503)-C(2))-methyltransferase RlmN [Desulfosporosinus sp. PR]|uniref:23S rRNA (adenine(2503)-C(2))-methyltransferase RlmN n=1 Tax=Candidatus Desulfosporosinus nitrosoreducens TaxID=3401928 RepID=UPI0027FA8291|nr:23S rRNA (adenine(2503)-C(2))-methyltransferase RlmN [Desulfosporosinus sp. PR]MDQ7094765.1 23S rRNA (adenine(2503)-C(2))-methyltransferase RlmN [Desulfosporosinus sp. PR]